ncbi:MAG: hypothetical protein HDS04_03680 [Bacteroides sp.]|nr:hypothetical protein [Bacteroides sp.]
MKTSSKIKILTNGEIKEKGAVHGTTKANQTFRLPCYGTDQTVSCSGTEADVIFAEIGDSDYPHFLVCYDEDGNSGVSDMCDLSKIDSGDSGDSGNKDDSGDSGTQAKNRYDACKNKAPGTPCSWKAEDGFLEQGSCAYVSDITNKTACKTSSDFDWPPRG